MYSHDKGFSYIYQMLTIKHKSLYTIYAAADAHIVCFWLTNIYVAVAVSDMLCSLSIWIWGNKNKNNLQQFILSSVLQEPQHKSIKYEYDLNLSFILHQQQ